MGIKNKKFITIAHIPICITSSLPFEKIHFRKAIHKFFCTDIKPRVVVNAHYGKMPRVALRKKELIFQVKQYWSLYLTNKKYIFVHEAIGKGKRIIPIKSAFIKSRILKFPFTYKFDIKYLKEELPLPYRLSVFERDFSSGEVYVKLPRQRQKFSPSPLAHNLLELILFGILYLYKLGIALHCCGVKDRDIGYLFVGPVGSGKSTMAELWHGEGAILHDDRIIIRKLCNDFWIFSSSWYGKLGPASVEEVKLKKIFFIHHDNKNTVIKLNFKESLSKLLTQTQTDIPTWFEWYKKAILFNSVFCMDLAKNIPCYSLGFTPDRRIIDFVRDIK